MPWGLHVGPRAGPEGTVSTGASREDAVLPTLLHFGPAPGSPSVPQCPPVPHCPNVLLSVLQYPPAPQRPPGASVVLQCPSVPLYPRVSVSPGDEEPLPMDRSRARGSLPQDTPGGERMGRERRAVCRYRDPRWGAARPGGRGGRGGGRREAKEGGGSALPPRPVQGRRRAGSGRGRLGLPPEGGGEGGGGGGRTVGRTERSARSSAPGPSRTEPGR